MIPPDAELTARPEEIPAWDDMPDDLKPVLRPPDGGLRRLHGAHRPPHRPADRRARRARGPRRHARLRDHRRQRRLGRGHARTARSTSDRAQRRRRARDGRVHDRADRRVRHAEGVQPLRGRLGARDGHALPVDEAGRLALGRHAQRDDRALAARHRGQGRDPRQFHHVIDVAPTVLEAAGLPEPTFVHGVQQMPMEGVEMVYSFDDAAAPSAARPSTSRCSSTAASTTRAGPPCTRHSIPWVMARRCRRSTTTSGSCTHPTTGRRRGTSRPQNPRSSPSCSGCS